MTTAPIKTEILTLRVSEAEREKLARAAKSDDRPLSVWLRKVALEAANKLTTKR